MRAVPGIDISQSVTYLTLRLVGRLTKFSTSNNAWFVKMNTCSLEDKVFDFITESSQPFLQTVRDWLWASLDIKKWDFAMKKKTLKWSLSNKVCEKTEILLSILVLCKFNYVSGISNNMNSKKKPECNFSATGSTIHSKVRINSDIYHVIKNVAML